jgi:FixJ family two-component response regulator
MLGDEPVIYIVDDDFSVRESLQCLLGQAGWRVLVFGSALEFLRYSRPASPGCLILDLSLPDLNGLELQRRLIRDRTAVPIIFVTGHGDIPTTVQAMKAGAVEFLTKPFRPDILLSAIEGAIERSRASLECRADLQALQERHERLSRREREVMDLVVRGRLNKQVGGQLGISEITVKSHRGRVMRKMQARSLVELVNMAARLSVTTAAMHSLGHSAIAGSV